MIYHKELYLLLILFFLSLTTSADAEDVMNAVISTEPPAAIDSLKPSQTSSEEIVKQAWEASSKNDLARIKELLKECTNLYGKEAKEQQAKLSSFPVRGEEKNYQSLNDVALCHFIYAEALMNLLQIQEAVAEFKHIVEEFKWAQSWDPSRGTFWSVAEKAQASINVLTGKTEEELEEKTQKIELIKPTLFTKGKEKVVDYTRYGEFLKVGSEEYHYSVKKMQALTEAVGEGIYPNTSDVYKNPRYKIVKQEGRLEGSHWDFVNSADLEAAYFKWVTAPEPWGTRLFYIGFIFEKSGMYLEALKAYHAIIVHFPKSIAWTYWQTPWYPAQAAIAKIRHIIRTHPELGLQEKWMDIQVSNGFDNDVNNDAFIVYPGKILKKSFIDIIKEKLGIKESVSLGKIKKTVGEGKVRLVQYENNHWQLLADNHPYVIKGITYAPTKVGQTPDKGTLTSWMEMDSNKNNLPDGPYESWVDSNRNNQKDADEAVIGDFELMKQMGVNTLRMYHQPFSLDKEILRKMYQDYGFRVILGDYVGKYTLGSGATWFEGTDYENPEHKKNMLESVKKMVMEHKDEPYVLMWLLGNENNYGVASNADKKPEAFFKFMDEVAVWIKSVDKNHPVAVSNGDTLYLDIFSKVCPHVDIFAANVYRGDYGFGLFWEQVLDASGKPAFIAEYGCPAFASHLTLEEAEKAQADYHLGNWLDIQDNLAGKPRGAGNALGGVVFEWLDEWWKNYDPFVHDRKSDAIGPFPGGYYFEEWFGLAGQGKGQHSSFLRQLRKSYFLYKELWNK